jgi:imidazolonepropionase-like amidohydrolase
MWEDRMDRTDKKILTGATVLSCCDNNVRERVDILIENGIIVDIGHLNAEEESGVEKIDLRGKTVIPGLIDAHVHINMTAGPDFFESVARETTTETVLRSVLNLKRILASGVTYIRDMGGFRYLDIELRDCLKRNLIDGPGMLASGKMITMTGGHGYHFGRECDGPYEVRKAAREQIKAGADVIKIMATGGIVTPGVEPNSVQLSEEEIRAAVEEAHNAGKKSASHAQATVGISNAVRAGIDSIEHGVFLDDKVIDLMLERGTYFVPTLTPPVRILANANDHRMADYVVRKTKSIIEHHRRSFQRACEKGVRMCVGTDAGTPFNKHGDTVFEIKMMVEYGMTPLEAIMAATKTNSELLGIDSTHGTLERGKAADFLILEGNPVHDITYLERIEAVFKSGKKVEIS